MTRSFGWVPVVLAGCFVVSTNSVFGQAVTEPPKGDANQAEGAFVEPRPGELRPPHVGGWYLGVYGSYTSTGMVLTEVYRGTAADRAGLEVGDRIVAINGQQIGVVGNSRRTLDTTLQREASGTGWVRLLVQDKRTLRLINVDVRLTWGRIHT